MSLQGITSSDFRNLKHLGETKADLDDFKREVISTKKTQQVRLFLFMEKKWLDRKIKLISKFVTSQPG